MSNIGEQIQNRLIVSEKIIASARTHASGVAEALSKRAIALGGDKPAPTTAEFEAMIQFLANGLAEATRGLRDAEHVVTAERADDLAIRTARDFAAAELSTLVARLRATLDAHIGNDGVAQYGLENDTPRTPRKLVEYVKNVIQLLQRNPTKVSSPFGSALDTAAAVALLEPKVDALDKIVADDDREWRELEDAYAKRNHCIEVWNETYQGAAGALEGLYRFAGMNDLASRVRPTLRKLRGDDPGTELAPPAPETT